MKDRPHHTETHGRHGHEHHGPTPAHGKRLIDPHGSPLDSQLDSAEALAKDTSGRGRRKPSGAFHRLVHHHPEALGVMPQSDKCGPPSTLADNTEPAAIHEHGVTTHHAHTTSKRGTLFKRLMDMISHDHDHGHGSREPSAAAHLITAAIVGGIGSVVTTGLWVIDEVTDQGNGSTSYAEAGSAYITDFLVAPLITEPEVGSPQGEPIERTTTRVEGPFYDDATSSSEVCFVGTPDEIIIAWPHSGVAKEDMDGTTYYGVPYYALPEATNCDSSVDDIIWTTSPPKELVGTNLPLSPVPDSNTRQETSLSSQVIG